ncbi:hypothetical protein H0H93_012838, partial [Arthromyces matolae]
MKISESAGLLPAIQVGDTLETTSYIEAQNVHEAPRASSKLEVRMADNDSHVAFQGLSAELVKYLDMPVDPSNIKTSAAAAEQLASNLGKINDPVIRKQVAKFLIWFRNPYKRKVVLEWPLGPDSKPSPQQTTAIHAIQLWEERLQNWNAQFAQELTLSHEMVKTELKSIMDIPNVQGYVANTRSARIGVQALEQHTSSLVVGVHSSSINVAQELHEQLQGVAAHVRAKWIPGWPESVTWKEDAKGDIE